MAGREIKGVYGIDAPYVPAIFIIAGVVLASVGVLSRSSGGAAWVVVGIFFIVQGLIYLHTTLRGKFILWRGIVDEVELPTSARVLDVGCGRGMAVITVLTQFPDATGMGLDLWRGQDQSGNDPSAIRANAEENGVLDRLYLLTENMMDMSIPDNEMDFTFAYVSIQNIKNREDRAIALAEIYRVTKPGGQIRIVDIQYTAQYETELTELGATDVTRHSLGFNGWFGNPFYACKLVSATKPTN